MAFRLGFIGAGFVARFHAWALASVRDVELVGVTRHGGSEALSAYSKELGVGECAVVKSIRELCEMSDAVAILSPNFVRVEAVEEIVDAIEKGAELKGLICEKPLARNMAEGRKVMSLAEKTGLPTAYLENQLHMKAIRAARTQLEPAGAAMGWPVLARCSEEHAGPHHGWFWDPRRQGGGALSDLACHSIAIGRHVLTPAGKGVSFMEPTAVSAETTLLKWGQEPYRKQLLETMGVDYGETPAEDYASGVVTFKNPETGQVVKSQFSNSWMYDKQGMRLAMDGLGPGYAFEINTLQSPLEVFVGDAAAEGVGDAESALEKSTATRGLLAVVPNEPDLYGYPDELADACRSFERGESGMLDWGYGLEIVKLCQAAYMSAERRAVVDLTDEATLSELEGYESAISRGEGASVLYR